MVRRNATAVGALAACVLLITGGCVNGGSSAAKSTTPALGTPGAQASTAASTASLIAPPAATTSPIVTTPSGSTSAGSPVLSATPAPSATPQPAKKPPFYQSNPVCAKVRCELLAAQNGIPHAGGKLRLEVIGLPKAADAVEQATYLALYDSAGKALYTTSKIEAWFVPRSEAALPGFTGISVDRAGRVFVPFGTGAHSSFLVVLDPSVRPVRTFGTLPSDGMRFFSVTPSSGALDVDGDGLNEVVGVVNDYEPSYAEGTSTAYYFKYSGGDFVAMGCTTISENTDIAKPPQSAPKSKACKAS